MNLYLRMDEVRHIRGWSVAYVYKLASRDNWRRIKVNHEVRYRTIDVYATLDREGLLRNAEP